MTKHDAKAELATLYDELVDALRRFAQSEEEAKPIIHRQILEIKRDIVRNTVISRETCENATQNQTNFDNFTQNQTPLRLKIAENRLRQKESH